LQALQYVVPHHAFGQTDGRCTQGCVDTVPTQQWHLHVKLLAAIVQCEVNAFQSFTGDLVGPQIRLWIKSIR
jgi:hypothetical protein